jgi:hypothetical protein
VWAFSCLFCNAATVKLLGQEPAEPPAPIDLPELGEAAAELQPLVEETWTSGPAPRQRSRYGVMSGWDLYAGSIYANTSPLWLHAEGLLWWMRGNELPALVTTSPNGTQRQDAGVLGLASTSILHGNERVDDRARGGFRTTLGIRLGHWFDHWMDSELEFGVLWLGDGQSSGDFYGISAGDPILARPFYDAQIGAQDAQLIGFPNVVVGEILIESSSDFLSTGAWFRQGWRCWDEARIDWVAGYRYAQLRERLLIEESLISIDPGGPVAIGTAFDLFDDFRTWNEFHGADLGLQFWTRAYGWTVEVLGKVAFGATLRTLEINGETITSPPVGLASFAPGGVLAMPTNIGRYQSSQVSVLPELTIRLRRPISRFFTLTMGYSALVLNNVWRTGDQIDLAVNPSQFNNGVLVGAARPAPILKDSVVWLQGFTIGLEW